MIRYRLSAVIVAMLFATVSVFAASSGLRAQEATPSPSPAGSGAASQDGGWVSTVEGVRPAVVTVVNEQQSRGFGNQGSQEAGRGTGFVIDAEGHVVTNWHVVDGGDQFSVILADGNKIDATLVGSDRLSDLAVVKVELSDPASLAWGDSSALQPGQPVLAIGSPLGAFSNTVTDGIVSAVGRDFPGSQSEPNAAYNNLIQHNAAINPGNSGGPLVNEAGEVVGINTLGISQVPGSGQPVQGLFFAIPSNTAQEIVRQLIENGRVAYPFMGISVQAVTPQLASQYDLPVEYGAFVQRVTPNGPAAQAGIQQGDFIVAIDGQPINQENQFSELLFSYQPDEQVEVTINRNGQEQQVQVTLSARPQE